MTEQIGGLLVMVLAVGSCLLVGEVVLIAAESIAKELGFEFKVLNKKRGSENEEECN